jgi:hypothetical protein
MLAQRMNRRQALRGRPSVLGLAFRKTPSQNQIVVRRGKATEPSCVHASSGFREGTARRNALTGLGSDEWPSTPERPSA